MKLYDSVERILKQKGSQVYSVPSDVTVYEALEEMADLRISEALSSCTGPIPLGLFPNATTCVR